MENYIIGLTVISVLCLVVFLSSNKRRWGENY